MSGVVVAYAVRAPAGPERTDDVLGPWPGWLVALGRGLRCRQLKPACTRASSAVPSRCLHGFSRSLLTSRSPLTPGGLTHQRAVFTALILGPALNLPGCKLLHLTFSPSWAANSLGRVKTQIIRVLAGVTQGFRPKGAPGKTG